VATTEPKKSTVIAFFIPLPEPLGIPHGTTYSFDEESVIPDVEPLPVFVTKESPPVPGRTANRLFVSLKFWRAKSTIVQLIEQMLAVGRVLDAVRGSFPERPAEAPSIDCPLTVVEAVTQLTEQSPVGIVAAFDRCLIRVGEVALAYGLATRQALAPITLRRLPPLVTYMTRNGMGEDWDSIAALDLGHYNEIRRLIPHDLDKESLERMLSELSAIAIGDPVVPYQELAAESRRAFEREGDTRTAVIHSQAACEVLLDSVFLALLWEEGMAPADAVAAFFAPNSTLGGRVRRSDAYAARLGSGNWRLDGSGPVATWYSDLADLRNRCVHAGYRPTNDEALAASRAQYGLRDFIVDRLVDRKGRYPRTASLFTSRARTAAPRHDEVADFRVWRDAFTHERGAAI
jgi:hypothetical protein